jgi:integrase
MKPELRLVKEQPRGEELRDPVKLYLATLSPTGRRTMGSKLRTLQRLLEIPKIEARDLSLVVFAARSVLQDAGAAPATINATLSALKGVARAAWQIGQISAEDLERVRDVNSVRGSRLLKGRAHSDKEIEAVTFVCMNDRSPAGPRDAAIIALGYNLGLRRAECATLDVSDYSPSSATIHVRGKGDKERIAFMVDKGASEALADWLNVRTMSAGPLLCPVTRQGKIIYRRLSDQAIYNAMISRGRAAGVPNFTPHNLRRTFATELLDRGADIAIVQKLLGHSRVETTTLYDRRGDPARRKAAALLTLPYQNQRQPELPFGDAWRKGK